MKAEAPMRRVVELNPESRMGHEALVRLYQTQLGDPRTQHDPTLPGKLADAQRGAGRPAAPQPAPISTDGVRAQELYRLAQTLVSERRWSDAIAALEEAIQIGPYDEGGRYRLGQLMEEHAPASDLVRTWSALAAKDPKPQTSYFFWAVGLEKNGDLDGAIEKLRAALEIDPAHEMSENRWGLILEKKKRLQDALAHFTLATEIFPDFRDAHENAARVLEALGRSADARAERDRARSAILRRHAVTSTGRAGWSRKDGTVARLQSWSARCAKTRTTTRRVCCSRH